MTSATTRRLALKLLAVTPLLLRSGAAPAETTRVAGEVFYRPRIALPEVAVLNVRLVDQGDAAHERPLAFLARPAGQVPIPFDITIDGSIPSGAALAAEIVADGALLFATETPVPLDPADLTSLRIEVAPTRRSSSPETPQLIDTEWSLDALRGKVLLARTYITLTVDAEARMYGTSGVNWYGGEAVVGEGSISLTVTGKTLAGWNAEGELDQEFAYLEALDSAVAYRVEQRRLVLTDATGEDILVFRPRR